METALGKSERNGKEEARRDSSYYVGRVHRATSGYMLNLYVTSNSLISIDIYNCTVMLVSRLSFRYCFVISFTAKDLVRDLVRNFSAVSHERGIFDFRNV